MVVFQIKSNGDADSFLFEAPCETSNDTLIRNLVEVWNLRIRLRQLAGGVRELAQYGPMKPPDKAGLDHIEEKYKGETLERGPYYEGDPTGIRNGNGVGPQLADTMDRVARDAEASLDKVIVFFSI